MMKSLLFALAPLAALAPTPVAHAQNCAGCSSQCQAAYGPTHMQQFHDTYYINSIWPRQYIAPARRGICQTYELMIANGWRRNNLLTKFDFDAEGKGLSEAGRLHVAWILTQAPPQRRTIYVQRGVDVQATAQRIEAVQLLAAEITPGMNPADIQETLLEDVGHPAQSVDAVFTGFGANQPLPVLPASNASGSGESGS